MTDCLLCISKTNEKEVFTIKANGAYFAVVNGEHHFYIDPEPFNSPLRAANHARKLKRVEKINGISAALKKSVAPAIRSKVCERKQLFTEAEVKTRTNLSFKEVWVIVGPLGNYVAEAIENRTLVSYNRNKNKAKVFNTYEEAICLANTLDMVLKKGHQLRRYFEKQS